MNVFNLIAGAGGSSEGMYIWKKYGAGESVRQLGGMSGGKVIQNTTGNNIVYSATTYTYSKGVFTLVNPSVVVQGAENYANGYNYMCIGGTSASELYVCNTKPSTTAVLVTINSNNTVTFSDSTGYILNELYTDGKALFLDYVISDKEDAYPDGAVHDGYYYERYKGIPLESINALKFETGTITSASGYPTSLTVNHSLGEAPTKAFLIAETMPARGADWLRGTMISPVGITGSNSFIYKSGRGIGNTGRGASNSTTVTFNTDTTYTFGAGVTYRYILFAGEYYPM